MSLVFNFNVGLVNRIKTSLTSFRKSVVQKETRAVNSCIFERYVKETHVEILK